MNLLSKLTIKNLKLNKKRTIVTIIGIMLSVALLTAVSSMYSSSLQAFINYETAEKGNFHVAYFNVPSDEIDLIRNNRKIDDIFLTSDIGYSYLKESRNEYKPYIFVKGFTNDALDNLSIKLVDGRMPEDESEILIPTHLNTNGRVKYNIGDKLTLKVGKRVREGNTLTQDNPYDLDVVEELTNKTTRTYTIVGIMERPASNIEPYSAPGYTLATLIDENNIVGDVNVYSKYNLRDLDNFEDITANILGINANKFKKHLNGGHNSVEEFDSYEQEVAKAKYKYNINYYLIMLQTNPLKESSMKGLGVAVFIVCIIIVISSVFCIKNSFDISITEKTKQYGMLRSVGATKKQIRHNVLYEAFILGIIGIPLGILAGLIASFILCVLCNYLLKDLMTYGFEIPFVINYIALIFSMILGSVTIYLSAVKSARRASKISPIDSIRNSAGIKIKRIRSSKLINKIFGIGGEISYKNLKRNKKKYRTTVVSIIVSATVFIALSYFISLFYLELSNEINAFDYNISYSYHVNNDTSRIAKVNESVKLEGVENYSIVRSENFKVKNKKVNESINYVDEKTNDITVMSISDHQFKLYIKGLNLNYNDVVDKGILMDLFEVSKQEKGSDKTIIENDHLFAYKNGDKISLYNDDNLSFDVELATQTDIKPFGIKTIYYDNSLLIVSDKFFNNNINDSNYVQVFAESSNPDAYQDMLDELFEDEDINIYNFAENARLTRNLLTLISIFLYGFIIVVSLIGVTNIFNTITTNMELRKPEFAMLKSVGMTKKEFSRMIRLESIFMCAKSLIIAIPLGIAISYLIYKELSEGTAIKFYPPLFPIIITIIAVIILINIIMKFSIKKINKQNTIETIRNENI